MPDGAAAVARRGVRFVQVSHTYKWDQHADLLRDHAQNAREVDKPIAGLLHDLKARGLLKDTLVRMGRRVRPHADRAGLRRPRSQSRSVHLRGWPAAA